MNYLTLNPPNIKIGADLGIDKQQDIIILAHLASSLDQVTYICLIGRRLLASYQTLRRRYSTETIYENIFKKTDIYLYQSSPFFVLFNICVNKIRCKDPGF